MLRGIAPDKWKHFLVGIPMGCILQVLAFLVVQPNLTLAIVIASTMVIAISYGFELFSLITGWGRYDFMDAVASVVGGTVGIILCLGIMELF